METKKIDYRKVRKCMNCDYRKCRGKCDCCGKPCRVKKKMKTNQSIHISTKCRIVTALVGDQRRGNETTWIGEVSKVLSEIKEGVRFDDHYTTRFRKMQRSRQLIKSGAFDLLRMIAER